MKLKKLIGILIFSTATTLYGQSVTPPLAPLPANLPKATWMNHVTEKLPKALCTPNQIFLQCYDTTAENCTEFTGALVKACVSNIAIALPETLNKTEGERWGEVVGRCTYDLYTQFMASKRKELPNCPTVKATQP